MFPNKRDNQTDYHNSLRKKDQTVFVPNFVNHEKKSLIHNSQALYIKKIIIISLESSWEKYVHLTPISISLISFF